MSSTFKVQRQLSRWSIGWRSYCPRELKIWQKDLKSSEYSQTSQLSNGYWCKRIWKSSNGQNSFRVALWMFLLSETRPCLNSTQTTDIKLLPSSTQSKIFRIAMQFETLGPTISQYQKWPQAHAQVEGVVYGLGARALTLNVSKLPYRRQNEKIAQIDANGYQPSTI